jgi:hypothetical protein
LSSVIPCLQFNNLFLHNPDYLKKIKSYAWKKSSIPLIKIAPISSRISFANHRVLFLTYNLLRYVNALNKYLGNKIIRIHIFMKNGPSIKLGYLTNYLNCKLYRPHVKFSSVICCKYYESGSNRCLSAPKCQGKRFFLMILYEKLKKRFLLRLLLLVRFMSF